MFLCFLKNLFFWNSLIFLLGENNFLDLFYSIKLIEKFFFLSGTKNEKKFFESLKLGYFKMFIEIVKRKTSYNKKKKSILVFFLKNLFIFLKLKKSKSKSLLNKKKKKINNTKTQDFGLLFLKIKKIFPFEYEPASFNFSFVFFYQIFFGKKKISQAKTFFKFFNIFLRKNKNKKHPVIKLKFQIGLKKKIRSKKKKNGYCCESIFNQNGIKSSTIFKKNNKNFILNKISILSIVLDKVTKKSNFKKKINFSNDQILFQKILQNKYFCFFFNFLPVFYLGYYRVLDFQRKIFSFKVGTFSKNELFFETKTCLKKTWKFIYISGIKYAKLGLIGKGGNSKVYKIIDNDKRVFALKKTRIRNYTLENLHGSINEISILKTLNDQPRIIQIKNVDILLQKGLIYIVLEYGVCDLDHLIKKMNKEVRSLLLIKFFWKQILEGVHTIHEGRVVHGDIKPSNFLLIKNSLKIIDFGIAKQIQKDTTNITRHIQIGTLNYMSPEAIMDIPSIKDKKKKFRLSRSADIWSLGCILFQMIYKKPPFYHLTVLKKIQAIVNRSFDIFFLPTTVKFVIDTIKGCLDRNPESRPLITELLEHPFLTSGNILKFNKKKN